GRQRVRADRIHADGILGARRTTGGPVVQWYGLSDADPNAGGGGAVATESEDAARARTAGPGNLIDVGFENVDGVILDVAQGDEHIAVSLRGNGQADAIFQAVQVAVTHGIGQLVQAFALFHQAADA